MKPKPDKKITLDELATKIDNLAILVDDSQAFVSKVYLQSIGDIGGMRRVITEIRDNTKQIVKKLEK